MQLHVYVRHYINYNYQIINLNRFGKQRPRLVGWLNYGTFTATPNRKVITGVQYYLSSESWFSVYDNCSRIWMSGRTQKAVIYSD